MSFWLTINKRFWFGILQRLSSLFEEHIRKKVCLLALFPFEVFYI